MNRGWARIHGAWRSVQFQGSQQETRTLAVSSTKSAVLALTANTVDILHLSGWRYVASGQRFIHEPCPGCSVVLRVGWTFQGWTAFCQPSVSISSDVLRKTCKAVLGKLPPNEPLWHRYQSIWHKLGKYDLGRPHFYEELAETDRKPWQLPISETPSFIRGLIGDYANIVAPGYDLHSESGYLRSMPNSYDYNLHDPMTEPLAYVIRQVMLGQTDAVERFRNNLTVPPMIQTMLSPALTAIGKNMSNIPRICID